MSSAASEPTLIGLDWGTSSFRAYLLGGEGGVLERHESPDGILRVPDRDFAGALEACLADRGWGAMPIVASGMITSRNGWVETPYADLPSGHAELAAGLMAHRTPTGREVHFVPGLTTVDDGVPDVMRGEETEIIGAEALGFGDGIYVMPGTHAKWVTIEEKRVTAYATYMTGEIFAALKGHTILGTLMEADGTFHAEAFARGVEAAKARGTELLHTLFSVRTLPLFERLAPVELTDYMSGILIGAEIAAGRARFGAVSSVVLLGKPALQERYRLALDRVGVEGLGTPADCAARGQFEIARAAGLIG
ncbi:MAG: 2-dehydro-3-deoxygalactonokinase [Paracoccaceae bacterium]|nr:2-dehydro-3-deoxygalactonokinase [Paracoccaceae bacterium]